MEIVKLIITLVWKMQLTQKSLNKEKNECSRLIPPKLKSYYELKLCLNGLIEKMDK